MSGCLAVDRDPMADYDPPPRRASTQAGSPYPYSPSGWRGADGRPGQSMDMSPQTTAWMNSPSTSASRRPAATGSTKATTTAAKPAAGGEDKTAKVKTDDELVKATYTTAPAIKTSTSDAGPSLSAPKGALPAAKSTNTAEATKTAEAKSPSVNLGVLRLINSKRVTFRYEVKDPSSAGVAGLELWGTKDMRSWKKYEAVQKTATSFVVEVKDEGLYGFTMVARGKGEITKDQPPQTGEAPQVWVAVDTTKPTVQMLGAELNIMAQAPSLIVRWKAADKNFGPRPIALMYAEKLEGPWAPISANVENTGLYEWAMPACAPGNVYVRVQATDLMGNVGTAQTTLLHIPGRVATSAKSEPTNAEPPRLSTVPTAPLEPVLRPVAATIPNPAVSILSVDGE
jgi:hypothetical protein